VYQNTTLYGGFLCGPGTHMLPAGSSSNLSATTINPAAAVQQGGYDTFFNVTNRDKLNRFRGKAKGGIVREPLAATQAPPAQNPGQRHVDTSPQNQAELPPSAVMHPKRHFLGRSTAGTRWAIAHPFSSLHPSGMGLDFLRQIHDRRSVVLMRGACRDRQVRTPPVSPPRMLPR
jgi:hypothetical protein